MIFDAFPSNVPKSPGTDNVLVLTFKKDQQDSAGIIPFTEKDDPTKPLSFVATRVWVHYVGNEDAVDILPFDFVGTFLDFDEAATGNHSTPAEGGNKTNMFYKDRIMDQAFLYKGKCYT